MQFDRLDVMRSQGIKDCLDYFDGGIKINRDNRQRYEKAIKLEQAIDIYESDAIEVRKLYELAKLFKSSEKLAATYRIFQKYRDDELLKPYCDKIEEICEYLRQAEEKNMVRTAIDVIENEDLIDNFPIAKAIVEKFNGEKNVFTSDFLACNQLSKDDFDYYKDVVREYDRKTYRTLCEQEYARACIRRDNTRRCIRELYDAIGNGKTKEGIPFDELEFYNLLPFKNDRNLVELMDDYGVKKAATAEMRFKKLIEMVEPEKVDRIFNYMISHNIRLNPNSMMSHGDIKRENFIHNGKQITSEDKDVIISYLNTRNTPLYTKAVSLLRNKVMDGVISFDENKQLRMHI